MIILFAALVAVSIGSIIFRSVLSYKEYKKRMLDGYRCPFSDR